MLRDALVADCGAPSPGPRKAWIPMYARTRRLQRQATYVGISEEPFVVRATRIDV